MVNEAAEISVKAWRSDSLLLERYAYTSGSVEPIPKHSHEEYQFGLSVNCPGDFYYRGESLIVPTSSLTIIHSGEVHAHSDRTYLSDPANFEMLYVHPKLLQIVGSEMAEKPVSLPFFTTTFVTDEYLNRLYLALQRTIDRKNSELDRDVTLWTFLSYLIQHHASDAPSIRQLKAAHPSVMRTRDYLHAHYSSDISLDTLAAIAGLSRFHFCRLFRRELGVSPNAYQTQLRIDQSKTLLLQGLSTATVAERVGFYDQSHFGWHFKRRVGVTPSAYVRKKQQ
jgi:AraC-like DNA-binding protein